MAVMTVRDLFEQKILPLFEETRSDWLSDARDAARRLGEQRNEVTINDVREICPPPTDVDPRVMGAVFKRSEWKLLRHERSRRAKCHNRPVGVFTLKTRDANHE